MNFIGKSVTLAGEGGGTGVDGMESGAGAEGRFKWRGIAVTAGDFVAGGNLPWSQFFEAIGHRQEVASLSLWSRESLVKPGDRITEARQSRVGVRR